MTGYAEHEMLPLSGIQHYSFCPRQWALIHVEQLWEDNRLTVEGSLLHANVDNPFARETNGSEIVTLHGVRLVSTILGLTGTADVVELSPLKSETRLTKKELIASRRFSVTPVEYKRGHRKANDCDRLQVGAQAMALEEMLGVEVKYGSIFYWEERHRECFEITEEIRRDIADMSERMHGIIESGILPAADKCRSCRSCSLSDLCMPKIAKLDVGSYLLSAEESLNALNNEETA